MVSSSRFLSHRFRIREIIGNSLSFQVGPAFDVMYLEIQDLDNRLKAQFGYAGGFGPGYAGGGASIKVPMGFGFASDWVRRELVEGIESPISLRAFEGPATLASVGVVVGIGLSRHQWVLRGWGLPRPLGFGFTSRVGLSVGFQTTGGKLRMISQPVSVYSSDS